MLGTERVILFMKRKKGGYCERNRVGKISMERRGNIVSATEREIILTGRSLKCYEQNRTRGGVL